MATSGFAAMLGLLRRKGVRVRLRKDDSADQQDGTLTLHDGYEQELVFTVRPTTKAEPARTTTTSFVDILDVTLVEDDEDGVFCSTSLIEGTGFSFACSDGTGNVSGVDATKLVALVIKDALLNLQQQEEAAPTARRGVKSGVGFRRLLEPIGLLHEYYEAFRSAGIDSEDLSVVTREDLIELVGVSDRRHQIRILAQIKRCYPDSRPCCCGRQGNNTSAGLEVAGQAGSIVGSVIANLI